MAKHVHFFQNEGFTIGLVLRQGLAIFYFCFVFSKKLRLLTLALYFGKGLVFYILMKTSHFDFVFRRMC
jgi:hypothetical protein